MAEPGQMKPFSERSNEPKYVRGHTPEFWDRANRALALRRQGLNINEIANELGVTPVTAATYVKEAIASTPVENVTEWRAIQLDSLQLQKRRVLRIFLTEHPKVDHGHVVRDKDGTVVNDDDVTIRASAELRKIEAEISKLTGTRAPVVHEVYEISEDQLDAEIRRLTASLKQRAAALGADAPIDVAAWPTQPALPAGEAESAQAFTGTRS